MKGSIMNIKIYAVGSSGSIGHEIEDSLNSIFTDKIPIKRFKTQEIITHTDGDLYVCNSSQYAALLNYVPAEKILLLNISPTPQFYLKMATIPAGSDVYIVNSQLPFIEQLISSCRDMGVDSLNFIPVPYMEMDISTVCNLLKDAKYIAGVDRLLNDDILSNDIIRPYLRPDVTWLGAKRIAAPSSIFAVINRVNQIIREKATTELNELKMVLEDGPGDMLYQVYYDFRNELGELKNTLVYANSRDSRIEQIAINQFSQQPFIPKI